MVLSRFLTGKRIKLKKRNLRPDINITIQTTAIIINLKMSFLKNNKVINHTDDATIGKTMGKAV